MSTTAEKMIVMQAYEDGKEIEAIYNGVIGASWTFATSPNWNWAMCEYRIKPEPRKPRELYVHKDRVEHTETLAVSTLLSFSDPADFIKFREVIEDES